MPDEANIPKGISGAGPQPAGAEAVEAAWVLGETCQLLYDAIDTDPDGRAGRPNVVRPPNVPQASTAWQNEIKKKGEANADTTPGGHLATATYLEFVAEVPQTEQGQAGDRRFADGVPLGTLTAHFNMSADLYQWLETRTARRFRRIPTATYRFRYLDNTSNAWIHVDFEAKAYMRSMDAEITLEGQAAPLVVNFQITNAGTVADETAVIP